MIVKEKFAHASNYGKSRALGSIKFIVIHYTANDGDKAWNNANYFQNNPNLKASAHYFVDDDYIYRSVPDNCIAYSVGDKRTNNKGGTYNGICTNANSISIELCDTNKNGTIYPTQATIDRAIELTKFLMTLYNIDLNHVIRHFDVTGKECPKYWVNDEKWNTEFKSKLIVNQHHGEGWKKNDIGWWYLYADGTYPISEWKEIDGKWYYFKADGYMANNEYIKSDNYEVNQKLYYVNRDGEWNNKSYRWLEDNIGWWLAEIGGKWYAQNEWAKVNDKWYYFGDDGYMLKNRVITIDGDICHFNSDGTLAFIN